MVQPLFGNSKAEGDKVGGSIASQTTKTTAAAATTTTAKTGTTATNNPFNDFSDDAEAGDICLFTSNEELLDLDFYSNTSSPDLHTNYEQQVKKKGTSSVCDDFQKQISASLSSNNLSSNDINNSTINYDITNRFSIDSREQKFYSQQQQQQQSYYSSSSRRNTSDYEYFDAQSCCCWLWARYLKLAKWRSSAQALRAAKMALKRYYIVLLGLTLVIVSCLLASFVISRSVGGDLDATHSDDSSNFAGSSSRLNLSQLVELEVRTFDLVDLIECGKTFAYTKYRLRVKVPKSSPLYEQHPVLLDNYKKHQNNGNSHESDHNDDGDDTSKQAASDRVVSIHPHNNSKNPPASSEEHNDHHPKFILTSAKEALNETHDVKEEAKKLNERLKSIATVGEPPKDVVKVSPGDSIVKVTATNGALIKNAPVANVILADIVPVHPPSSVSRDKESSAELVANNHEHQPSELAALLALTSGRQAEPKSEDRDPQEIMESSLDNDSEQSNHDDPLEMAASDLHFNLGSVNKTLIDCFIVDQEKRYGQRVSVEDKFKVVARTRKVSFKKMMNTIVDCRLLTWATLPLEVKIKQQLLQQQQQQQTPLVASSSSLVETTPPLTYGQRASMAQDYIGSFLNGWFRQQPSNDNNDQDHSTATTTSSSQQQQHSKQVSASLDLESAGDEQENSYLAPPKTPTQTISDLSTRDAKNNTDKAERVRQASYFNMGISMVSGIVPNTLWCGLGDRASNYSEIGPEYMVDACCRAHDHCPVRLKPFTTDYGLVNWSMSTKSHCDCDVDFNECLLAVNSTLSNVIRTLYFRFIGLQCIDVENRDKINTLGMNGINRNNNNNNKNDHNSLATNAVPKW